MVPNFLGHPVEIMGSSVRTTVVSQSLERIPGLRRFLDILQSPKERT